MADPQFVTIANKDLGAGIDQQASENQIPDTYSEDILNGDPQPLGQITKRVGYQGYLGYLPIRVQKVVYTDDLLNNLNLYLDGSIDLSRLRPNPIVISGQTSAANTANVGDFPHSLTTKYYPTWSDSIRKIFLSGTHTLTTTGAEHALNTNLISVGVAKSTDPVLLSNETFEGTNRRINQSTFDINVDYTNGLADFEGFIYFLKKSPIAGSIYVSTPVSIGAGATTTTTIPLGTHNLSNFFIRTEIFQDDGTDFIEVQPDDATIQANGDVTYTVTNSTSSSISVFAILTAVPLANRVTGSAGPSSSTSVVIPITDGSTFPFVSTYLEDPITLIKTEVLPDTVTYDDVAKELTVSFTNSSAASAIFEIYFEFGKVVTNVLRVNAATIITANQFTDLAPALSIWGLNSAEIQGPANEGRGGWVNEIDGYRAAGEDRIVTGMGGNFFKALQYSEDPITYKFGAAYPRFGARVATARMAGPAIWDTTDNPGLTRGWISWDGGDTNWGRLTAVSWNSGTGWTDYVLSLPGVAINGVLSTIVSTVTNQEDYLTVQQAGFDRLNGEFKIRAISLSGENLTVSVENSSVISADWDLSDLGGKAGIFTDRLELTSASLTSPFLKDDALSSDLFDSSQVISVVTSSGNFVTVKGLTQVYNVPTGLRVEASRMSSILPLQDIHDIPTVENIVPGDMLTIAGFTRKIRVKRVTPAANRAVTITADGEVATVTLGSGDTTELAVGQTVLVLQTANYNGEQVITSILSATQFTFSTTLLVSDSGLLLGNCLELDENLLIPNKINVVIPVLVTGRFIPIEAPTTNFDLPATTHVAYLNSKSYSNQDFVKSTMSADNLYLNTGSDSVLKFDGDAVYRAGLFRWQSQLFVTRDTTAAAKIVAGNPSAALAGAFVNQNQFIVNLGDEQKFIIGNRIEHLVDLAVYTIRDIGTDTANGIVTVDRVISGGAGASSITKMSTFKYYLRLNAVDTNNNVIASAATGLDWVTVEIGTDAQIRLRLIGMPNWDIYDFNRLELQVYRTLGNAAPPYFLLQTIPMSFNNSTGYIDFVDTTSDSFLVSPSGADLGNLDLVNTALKGAELGTAWSNPPIAKFVTSVTNRLILANIKDDPTLDLQLIRRVTDILQADLTTAGQSKYLLLRDDTDTGTVTDQLNRIRFEMVGLGGAITIAPATDIDNNAGASFTVTSAAHGLVAKDWVYLYKSTVANGTQLQYAGWWQIHSATTNDFTILQTHSSSYTPSTADVDRYTTATNPADVPVLIGTDGNYGNLSGNRTVSDPYEFLGAIRLANAINAVMRKVDVTLTGQTTFVPWVTANAGNEYSIGQVVLKQPKIDANRIFALKLDTTSSGSFEVFINGVKRSNNQLVSSVINLFPSRVVVSYPNYPEIFEGSGVTLDTLSDSVIDVNSSDGQEITGIIPFFGDSAYGASNQTGILVVFKENSIYTIDLSPDATNPNRPKKNPQKLETQGLGCTAPASIAYTRKGIIFANESGLYRLNQTLQLDYIGKKIERLWQQQVDKDQLNLVVGHNYAFGRQYRISVPLTGNDNNTEVFNYGHTREDVFLGYGAPSIGSWARYDNFPVTGWANLLQDEYFGSTLGQVFSTRRAGDATDLRDDDKGITSDFLMRALDAGDPSIRKAVLAIISHFRVLAFDSSTKILTATDLRDTFSETDDIVIEAKEAPNLDGLSDKTNYKILTIRSSPKNRKGVYFQIRYVNSGKDQPFELTSYELRVAGQNQRGILEAANSGKASR